MAVNTPTHDPHRKRRRRVVLLLIPVLLLAGSWKLAKSYIDIEHYRPTIKRELEQLIRLPLDFGEMDLKLLPSPRLVVADVTLGEEDFKAFSPEVTVTADLWKLFQQQLELHVVTIHDLRVELPERTPDLRERWSAYMRALETPGVRTGQPALRVTLETITAGGARVFRGDTHFATGDLTVTEVTSDAQLFTFTAEGVGIAGMPTADGTFTLTAGQDPLLRGNAAVSGLPLANLTGDDAIPPFILNGDITYTHTHDGAWQFEAGGDVGVKGDGATPGTFTLAANYRGGDLQFERIQIASDPLDFDGNLALFHDGAWDMDIGEAVFRDTGITWLAARLPDIPFRDNPEVPSEGTLTEMRMGDRTGSGFTLAGGTIAVRGVDLRLGAPLTLPDLQGSATVTENAVHITALTGRHGTLAGTLHADFDARTLDADLTGAIHLQPDLPLPEPVAAAIRAESGTLELRALQATRQDGVWHFPSLRVDAALADAAVAVWDARTENFTAVPAIAGEILAGEGALNVKLRQDGSGRIAVGLTPGDAPGRWNFSGEVAGDLASPLWKPLFPDAIAVTGGHFASSRLGGVLESATFAPLELDLAAAITDFRADVLLDGFEDRLAFDSIDISTAGAKLAARLSGATERFGPLQADGEFDLGSGDIGGMVTLDPDRAPGLPEILRDGAGGALIARFSPLPLEIQYGGTSGLLRFSASTPLPLAGTLSFPREAGARAPLAFAATASLPAGWMEAGDGGPAVSGTIAVQCELTSGDGRINLRADATEASWGWSLLRKPAGFSASIDLTGEWGDGGPRLTGGVAETAGQAIHFTLSDGGAACESFTLDLAALAPLFPEGSAPGGSARGRFADSLDMLELTLDSATFTPDPEAPALSANGRVRRVPSGWSINGLVWAAGRSRGVANLAQAGGAWTGSMEAAQIDIDELSTARNALNRLAVRGTAGQEPAGSGEWPRAVITLTADRVEWVNATVENAKGTLEIDANAITLRDVSFAHGTGAGTGSVARRFGAGGQPDTIETTFQLREVNADLIEGLFMGDTRDLDGLFGATGSLAFPVPAGDTPLRNGMNGTIQFQAVNGTLGKAGLISKLLTALRTTDILRLRIPQLRDRGLTFNTLSGSIAMENGVFHLAPYTMADSTYVLEADALLDYPRDIASGTIEIQVLEGVTGVTRRIPFLGEAAGIVSKVFSVPIRISGAASDPTFRPGISGP